MEHKLKFFPDIYFTYKLEKSIFCVTYLVLNWLKLVEKLKKNNPILVQTALMVKLLAYSVT